ncbi:MAG: hypothetical protein FJZ38_01570 [Candidatus Rokubacteria bacterium]|nr:hypothetical protein [Candidatus Rokubacteria bacterium]
MAGNLLVGAFGFLVVWLGWASLGWPLIHDAPILHYIAWRILDGAVPYRDLFDMNFPGVYLFHLGVVRVLGTGDLAWRAVDLGVTGVAALLVALMAAPWGRVAAIGGALFFAAYHLAGGAWNAGQRDFLLCPLLLAGALGVVRWAERLATPAPGRGLGGLPALFGGGLALGAGMTIKPHTIVLAAALGVFILVRAGTRTGAPLAAFVGGIVVAPLAAGAWLAALGALGAWREIVLGYLVPLYSRVFRPADWLYFRWHVWVAILATLAVSVASVAWRRAITARHAVAMLGLAYGLAHFVLQRKGWEYHLYPLAVFAAVLLCAEVERARRPALGMLVAGLAAVVWLLGVKGAEAADSGWIAMKERRVTALVSDLAARTRAGETVQVLDTTDGGVHALLRARLVQPTRFVYDFHFFHHVEAPMIQRLRAELLRDLRARPPAVVVLWEPGWPSGGYERIAAFPALATWLEEHYVLARQGDGYRIHAKRHRS